MTAPKRKPDPVQTLMVTQTTVEKVFGMPGRVYLETLRAHPEIHRLKVGKRVYVRVEDLEAFLCRAQPVAPAPEVVTITSQEAFLAAVGLEKRK